MMDTLPNDVILIILRKLASGDPLSLLLATCASAPFQKAAADNPEIWKTAFLGSLGVLEEKDSTAVDRCWQEEWAKLDAEIEAVGGYKILLKTHYFKPSRSSSPVEQKQPAWHRSTTKHEKLNVEKVIILARLRGRPVLWGSFPGTGSATRYPDTVDSSVSVSLQPLYPIDFTTVLRTSLAANKDEDYTTMTAIQHLPAGISLEVYGFFNSQGSVEGQEPAASVQTWSGHYLPHFLWVPILDATVLRLDSSGWITPQHTNPAGIKGVFADLVFRSRRSPHWTFSWRDTDLIIPGQYDQGSLACRVGLGTLMRAG